MSSTTSTEAVISILPQISNRAGISASSSQQGMQIAGRDGLKVDGRQSTIHSIRSNLGRRGDLDANGPAIGGVIDQKARLKLTGPAARVPGLPGQIEIGSHRLALAIRHFQIGMFDHRWNPSRYGISCYYYQQFFPLGRFNDDFPTSCRMGGDNDPPTFLM